MQIQKILVSQPTPTSEKNPFADVATKHNVEITFHPFNNIECISLKEFRAQRIDILAHSAVIFTSKSTIDYFFTLAEQARITIPETMKYFCITEAIALYMQKYIVYRKRKIFFGKATFADLTEVMSKHKTLKFVFPLSENHKAEMPHALTAMGVQFSKLIISHTVPCDMKDLDPAQYQMALCYSPADVKVFTESVRSVNDQCKVATFGTSTAISVFDAGSSVDLAVPVPGIPSMAMGLDKYLAAIKSGNDVESFAMRTVPKKSEIGCGARRRVGASSK
ncbi:MAG: uroporphyrinogen-III synthase [Rikenellaceae bacterium]